LAAFIYFSLFTVLFYAQSATHIILPIVTAFLIGKHFYYAKRIWIAEVVLWAMIIGTWFVRFY
jgi:hypothetical protein